jgi:hypothetical protein
MKDKKIQSALISVFDKEGLEPIVTKLTENGVIIYSTGGTYDFIKKLGLPVVSVDSVTDFPEILGGRVKTLHPKIFGGILNQRDSKKDQKDLKKYDIPHIDLVIVDLYPFEETVANEESTHEDIIEKIDIGGISLIRAAGKNHKDVLVISTKDQYEILEKIIDDGLTTTLEEREVFAIDAFNVTSNYDTEIFKNLLDETEGENVDVEGLLSEEKSGVNLNIDKDDYHLNDYLVCWEKFGHRPNKILIHNTYSGKLFDEVITKYVIEKNVFTEVIPDTEELIINDKLFIKLDEGCYISYIVADRLSESSFIDSISFYYANGYEKVQDFIDELNDCVLDYEEDDSNKLNTIGLSLNGLEIEPISLHNIDLDNVDNYYNTETFRRVEKAVKQIKKADKGLTVFYGERGSGKTSIINYISSKLDRIVIFIPNNMIDHTINNPEFRKFIKKYDKPVLVLDDCEIAFTENYGRSNMFTSNLLQMVDGFLSDSINCNIVTIFNIDDEEEIDPSLLECNNLIDVIEFEMLSDEESNLLAKHIQSNKKYKNKTKLIDIIKKRSNKQGFEIGF